MKLKIAAGGAFDPASVKSRADLEALFRETQAAGTAPTVVSPLNWSLGAHFLGKLYDAQGDQREQFLADLRAGTADLAGNQDFIDIMDTFDLMLEYNLTLTKGDPYGSTVLAAMYVYRKAFTAQEFAVGQAQALVLFVIVSAIALAQVSLSRRREVDL